MKITMNYIGYSEYDYPAYKDNNNMIWLDTNYGHGRIELYSASGNNLESEPNLYIEDVYPYAEIIFETEFERHPREHDYRMLSRYQMDCNYYLGNGNRNARHLYFGNPTEHISEMEKLYNSFSDEDKPEWITWEDIQNYKKQMCEEV